MNSIDIVVNTAILKHKLWLEEFKQKVREEKESTFIDSQHKKTILRRSPSFEQQKAQVEEFFNGNPSQKEKEPEVVEGNNEVSFFFKISL